MPKSVASVSSIIITKPRAHAFSVAVPADLTDVLHSKGPLPGVKEVTEKNGLWNAPGDSRRVVMKDGSSAKETLTAFVKNERVAYTIDDFHGTLGHLVTHTTGAWQFLDQPDGQTHVDWTFTFFPKSSLTTPIVSLIAKRFWPGYAGAALQRVKELAEQS